MGSKLLFSRRPVVIDPDLAQVVGFDEAAVVQQIHYWLEEHAGKSSHFRSGRTWTYNSTKNWRKNFPFWGEDKIKKLLIKLESLGVVLSRNDMNQNKYDRTKWYSIDYLKLEQKVRDFFFVGPRKSTDEQPVKIIHSAEWHDALCEEAQGIVPNATMDCAVRHGQYHEINQEIIQGTTSCSNASKLPPSQNQTIRHHPDIFAATWRGCEEDLARLASDYPSLDIYSLADQIDYQYFVQPKLPGQRREPMGLLRSALIGKIKYRAYRGYTSSWRERRNNKLETINNSLDGDEDVTEECIAAWKALTEAEREEYRAGIDREHPCYDYLDEELIVASHWFYNRKIEAT